MADFRTRAKRSRPPAKSPISLTKGIGYYGGSSASPTPPAVAGDPIALTINNSTPMDVISGNGINGSGWTATVRLKDMSIGGSVDASKVTIMVRDPGYDTNGNATTVDRTIYGLALVRRQYPNNTQRLISAAGSDVDVVIAISDYIFAGTTILSASIGAGFYGVSNASNPGVMVTTNGSDHAYWKPHAAWVNIQDRRVGASTYDVELIAPPYRYSRNGQPVPCVKFTASDGTNNSATVTSSTSTLSSIVTSTLKPEVYKGTVSLTSLNQGASCTVNAQVYPWIGDSSAILDLSVDRVAALTPQQQRRLRFVNDRTGAYGGALAYVNGAAAYTPTATAPFNGSFTAANAFDNNLTTSYVSLSGTVPYLGMQFPSAWEPAEFAIIADNGTPGGSPSGVDLQYSDDGSSWTTHSSYTFTAWSGNQRQAKTITPASQNHTYWRILRQGGSTASMWICELQFMATVGGATVTSGYVSENATMSRALPFVKLQTAISNLQTYNNANKGHNDHSGSTVYLMDNGGSAQTHIGTGGFSSVAAGACWTDIKVDPLAVGAVTWQQSNNWEQCSMMKWSVPLTGNGFTAFYNSTQNGSIAIALENVAINTTGFSTDPLQGFNDRYFLNVTRPGGTTRSPYASAQSGSVKNNNQMVVGCDRITTDVSHAYLAVSNNCTTGGGIGSLAAGTLNDNPDGLIVANNNLRTTAGNGVSDLPYANRGLYLYQNLAELAIGGGVVAFNAHADGHDGVLYDMVLAHNSIMGDRGSRGYCDSAETVGQMKPWVTFYELLTNINIKDDATLSLERSGNTGNWAAEYGVTHRGTVSMDGSVNGTAPDPNGALGVYLGMYWNTTALNTVYGGGHAAFASAFVNPQAGTDAGGAHAVWGTGNGGGDYHLTGHASANPLKSRVAAGMGVLKYDLDGNLRRQDGTEACGCYTY